LLIVTPAFSMHQAKMIVCRCRRCFGPLHVETL